MHKSAISLAVGMALSLLLSGPARAAGAALVEEISAPHPGVQAMEMLSPGQRIALGSGERLVIAYLKSCIRETIVGGIVSIGAEASTVIGGKVTRETVECDGGKAQLTTEQASKSAVMEFRRGPRPQRPIAAPSD
jgi:hypothetical protein